MLKALYTLSEKYRDKSVYIYGIDRPAICIFTDLVYRGMDIQGFVEMQGRFIGECFMNRPIVDQNALCRDKDIVIIPTDVLKTDIQKEMPEIGLFYRDEVLDLDWALKSKKIILYGMGKGGEEKFDLLDQNGIDIEAVCVTEKTQDVWRGKKVYAIGELELDSNEVFIITVKQDKYKDEILRQITSEGYSADIYIDCISPWELIAHTDFFQVINKAICEKKECVLYGNNVYSELVECILERYHVSVNRKYVYEYDSLKNGAIYELAYENTDNITVIIAEDKKEKTEEMCSELENIGFSLSAHNYTAMIPKADKWIKPMKTVVDSLVGHAVKGNGKLPGYVVYGDMQESDLKILIFGGSTSTDGYYRTIPWTYRFYQKFKKAGYNAVIYNGAACGYSITQELLRLIRDGRVIKPDYVISLSGLNDIGRKKGTNQFCIDRFLDWVKILAPEAECFSGLYNNETLYEFWRRNTEIMEMVSELYGAKFYSFLQPMNSAKKNPSLFEIGMHDDKEQVENCTIFRERAKSEQDGLFMNIIDIFDNETGMYIDYCHYSDEGNEIIANIVFNIVMDDIKSKVLENEKKDF